MVKTSKIIFSIGSIIPISLTLSDVFGHVAGVEGISMQPVLNPEDGTNSDYIFLNKWDRKYGRGDVVSLISPNNPNLRLVKRIIGLPGDDIRTRTYKNQNVVLPEGHLWVEGDNHGHSLDSNVFGPVPIGLVSSKAQCIVWPPNRWQKIQTIYPKDRINKKASVFRTSK